MRKLYKYDTATSHLTRTEIEATWQPDIRNRLLALLDHIAIFDMTPEMTAQAHDYINAGLFSQSMFNDAIHLADAVLSRQNVLLSWNFKHFVNRRQRAKIDEVNTSMGLPMIEILAPPEL